MIPFEINEDGSLLIKNGLTFEKQIEYLLQEIKKRQSNLFPDELLYMILRIGYKKFQIFDQADKLRKVLVDKKIKIRDSKEGMIYEFGLGNIPIEEGLIPVKDSAVYMEDWKVTFNRNPVRFE